MRSYTPVPRRGGAAALTLTLITSALILAGASLFFDGLSSKTMKLAAFTAILFSAVIISRYLTFTYRYDVGPDELAVYKQNSKIFTAVCRLSISELVSAEPAVTAKKKAKGLKLYDYRISLFTKDYYYVFFDTSAGREALLLECGTPFAEEINRMLRPDPLTKSIMQEL